MTAGVRMVWHVPMSTSYAAGRSGMVPAPRGTAWAGSSTLTRATETTTTEDAPARELNVVTAPVRDRGTALAGEGAVALVPVYRAVQVLTTAAAQLPIVVERAGRALTGREVPALVRKPQTDLDRSEWLEQCVLSLALHGELFLHRIRDHATGEILELRVLPAPEVTVTEDPKLPPASPHRITYHHQGRKYNRNDVGHQALMRLPGKLHGLGPIQAARAELLGALDVRDYSAQFFDTTGEPAGILTAPGAIGAKDARHNRRAWNGQDPETGEPLPLEDNPSRVRVLGNGMTYTPLRLSPADAQWLESRKFSTTEIARLFGVPSSLMLAPTDGTSMTYQNTEQEWIGFVRFTLMAYLRKIEEALTALTPLGQVVRFNLEGLLRTDTASRYAAHASALGPDGFLTVDEVRHVEGLPPLTDAQREEILARRAAARAVAPLTIPAS